MTPERVIGSNNTLPWERNACDMQRFRERTTGHTVLMGYNTYRSIGRALPNRNNIVLSKKPRTLPNCTVRTSLEDALAAAANLGDTVYVIGGGQVFAQTLPLADTIHLTIIPTEHTGDTHFPNLPENAYSMVTETSHPTCKHLTYKRINHA